MTFLVICTIILCIAGIIALNKKPSVPTRNRDEALAELSRFLEGTLEPIDDQERPNAFRINFQFSGESFIYEDYEKQGFKDKIYSGLLSVQAPSGLTLTFLQRKRSSKIRTDIFIASEVSTDVDDSKEPLNFPMHLMDFNISTNDNRAANKLLADGKVAAVYKHFKRVDPWGYGIMPIQIVNGKITLDFHPEAPLHPNVANLYKNIPVMENHLHRILTLVRALKKIEGN